MFIDILNITWSEKEYVIRDFKCNLIRKRIFYIGFQNITLLEKKYLFRVYILRWLEKINVFRDLKQIWLEKKYVVRGVKIKLD